MGGRVWIISNKCIKTLETVSEKQFGRWGKRKLYHDNSWCTETTLGTMELCNPLLDRMRTVTAPNTLHCDNMFSVNTNQRREASVN